MTACRVLPPTASPDQSRSGTHAARPATTAVWTSREEDRDADAPTVRSLSSNFGRQERPVGSVVQGKVKFFDHDRGFGFLSREGGGEDVFVHVSDLQAGGTTLTEGQSVEFEVGPGRKSRGSPERTRRVTA